MSQNPLTIADGTGAVVLNEITAALGTLASLSSGPAAPGTPVPYQLWADTTTGLLKQLNAAGTGWVVIGPLADLGLQSSAQIVANAGGSADAITAAYTPAVTALSNGLTLKVRAASANATATPTFAPNAIAAAVIVKGNGLPLVAGDIAGAGHWLELQWDATLTKWVLLNPLGISQGAADARYLPLAGNAAQVVSVAPATLAAHATRFDQAIAIRTANVTPVPVATGSVITVSHSLGVVPALAILEYVCLVAEQGFSIGDVCQVVGEWTGSVTAPVQIWKNSTQVGISCSASNTPMLENKTTGAVFSPTAANWAYRFVLR